MFKNIVIIILIIVLFIWNIYLTIKVNKVIQTKTAENFGSTTEISQDNLIAINNLGNLSKQIYDNQVLQVTDLKLGNQSINTWKAGIESKIKAVEDGNTQWKNDNTSTFARKDEVERNYIKNTDYENYKKKLEKILFNHTHEFAHQQITGMMGMGGMPINNNNQNGTTSEPLINFRNLIQNTGNYDPTTGWKYTYSLGKNTAGIGNFSLNKLVATNYEYVFNPKNDFNVISQESNQNNNLQLCDAILNTDDITKKIC